VDSTHDEETSIPPVCRDLVQTVSGHSRWGDVHSTCVPWSRVDSVRARTMRRRPFHLCAVISCRQCQGTHDEETSIPPVCRNLVQTVAGHSRRGALRGGYHAAAIHVVYLLMCLCHTNNSVAGRLAERWWNCHRKCISIHFVQQSIACYQWIAHNYVMIVYQ